MNNFTSVARPNGIVVQIEKEGLYYTYMVWQPSQVEAIKIEYERSGRTPSEIIDEAIQLLKNKGCIRVGTLVRMLGISQPLFVLCKQAEPRGTNILKMGRHDSDMVVWLRGKSTNSKNTFDSRPIGDKTKTVIPVWNPTTADKARVNAKHDNYNL